MLKRSELTPDVAESARRRLSERTEMVGACLLWRGPLDRTGYGRIYIGKRGKFLAHRAAYELTVGQIPDGLVIDHLCRNRACVEPSHLEPVTNRENVLRGMSPNAQIARVGRCLHGHELTPANINTAGKCRRCAADRTAEYRSRKRQ